MKYNNTYYMQVPRTILKYDLSSNAIHLYIMLKELEQRYCGENKDYFWHTDEMLSEELNWSISKVRRTKDELLANGIISTALMPFRDAETDKRSERHVTVYRILV